MVRLMEIQELETVLGLWFEMNQKDHDFINIDHWIELKEAMTEVLGNSNVYVYEDDEIIRGFVFVSEGYYIGALYVEDGVRRKLIGTQLIAHLKARYDELVIDVYEKNTIGRSFILSQGFSEEESKIEESTGEVETTFSWFS